MTILESGRMSSALETKEGQKQLSGSRISPLAGKPAPREMLVDLARLEKEYFDRRPDLEDATSWLRLEQAATAERL